MKSNERTDRLKENINGIITKKSLSLKWISDRNISQQGLRSLPISKVSGDERRLEAMNEDLFLKTSKEELQLQLKVEHNVLMHDSSRGKSIRQRKGAKLKKYCRKITLMDAAAQFINGITGRDRSTASSFSLGYNKNALQSVLVLGTALRDILEEMTFSDLSIENSSIATEGRDSSFQDEFESLMASLTPNEQVQGRILNRTLWSISKKEFEENHIKERNVMADIPSNTTNTRTDSGIGGNYFLDDDDEDSDRRRHQRLTESDDRQVSVAARTGHPARKFGESGAGNEFDESPLDGEESESAEDQD